MKIKLSYDDIVFDKKYVLYKGEMVVREKTITVIKGRNGSGKSSLVKQAISNLRAETGVLYVNQSNNMVLQELSVLENISMCTDELYNEIIAKKVYEFGLGEILVRDIKKLSGGEKRIVTLMRGFFSKENIIVIDEPTNDLDFSLVEAIERIICRLKEEKTIIMVTHDDRLLRLADYIFEIKDKRLELIFEDDKERQSDESNMVEQRIIVKKDKNILKKIFRFNKVSFLLMLLLVVSQAYLIKKYMNDATKDRGEIRENQMNIYSPISTLCSSSNINGLFSSSCLKLLKTSDIFDMLSIIEKEEKLGDVYLDNLCIEESPYYSFYPIEYYDTQEKKFYFVADYYLEKKYGVSQYDAILNTDEFLQQPYIYAGKDSNRYEAFKDEYSAYAKELVHEISNGENDIRMTCGAVVFFDNFDLMSVSETEMFHSLMESGVYIRSKQLNECVDRVEQVKGMLKLSLIFLILCFFVAWLDGMYWILLMRNHKNKILVLKDYGYDLEDVRRCFKNRTNNRILRVALFICLFGWNIFVFTAKPFEQINYYMVFLFAVILSVMYSMTNVLIEKILRKYYRWFA